MSFTTPGQAPGLPSLGVMPTKFQAGTSSLAEPAQPLFIAPVDQVVLTAYPSDAHFTCYQVWGPHGTLHEWPRLRKPILPELKDQGFDVKLVVFAIDIDTPGHTPWTPELWAEWQRIRPRTGFSFYHTTRAGARFLYVLQEPIDAVRAEDYHRGLVEWLYREAGLVGVDRNTSDWTHCFRLPYVLRDGIQSWQSHFFEAEQDWSCRLDISSLQPLSRRSHIGKDDHIRSTEMSETPPDRDQSLRLCFQVSATTKFRETEWAKEAKKALKGHEVYSILFEGVPIGEEGSRDNNVQKFVGQALRQLFFLPQTTPQHVYGLFIRPLEELEPDDQTPDWLLVGWSAIRRHWGALDIERQSKSQSRDTLLSSIKTGMRCWSRAVELVCGDKREEDQYVLRHLICTTPGGKSYHLINEHGYYRKTPVDKTQLIPEIVRLGLDQVIPVKLPAGNGGFRWATAQEIINAHSFQVSLVEGVVGRDPGGHVTERQGEGTLHIPLYHLRDDLTPRFDPNIDEWLKSLVSSERDYQRLKEWIAWSLDFEGGPIAALSYVGRAGAGKKLLVQGLAECVTTERFATNLDVSSGFREGLMYSPFLQINEGFTGISARDVASLFRQMTTGDAVTTDRKFQSQMKLRTSLRLIITANNENAVLTVTGDQDLGQEDKEAIAQRIVHIDGRLATAADYLRARGGARYTRGWIAPDNDDRGSDYRVARHFLYLYAKRGSNPPGSRLLVEGDLHQQLMRELTLKTGAAPLIIETLVRLLGAYKSNPAFAAHTKDFIVDREWRIMVSVSAVQNKIRKEFPWERVNGKQITSFLRTISRQCSTREYVDFGTTRVRKRWYEVNPWDLKDQAFELGYDTAYLDEIISHQMLKGINQESFSEK